MQANILRSLLFLILFPNLLFSQTGFNSDDFNSFYMLENYKTTIGDTQAVIDYDCALFISPSANFIATMKLQMDTNDFYTIADDNNWYDYQAKVLLDSMKVRVEYQETGVIFFVGDNSKSWLLDFEKPGALGWNLILFNRSKKPQIVDAIDISIDQIKSFFY